MHYIFKNLILSAALFSCTGAKAQVFVPEPMPFSLATIRQATEAAADSAQACPTWCEVQPDDVADIARLSAAIGIEEGSHVDQETTGIVCGAVAQQMMAENLEQLLVECFHRGCSEQKDEQIFSQNLSEAMDSVEPEYSSVADAVDHKRFKGMRSYREATGRDEDDRIIAPLFKANPAVCANSNRSGK